MRELVTKAIRSAGIPSSIIEPMTNEGLRHQRMPTCADYGLERHPVVDEEFRKRWLRLDEYCPEIKEMCVAVELWVKRCLTDGPGNRRLILAGRIGTGKSTVARRAVRTIATLQVSAWYERFIPTTITTGVYEWSKLASIGPSDRNDQSCWIDAVESKAALIDDIGTEVDKFKSGAPTENLRLLLEARRDLWTIITTNVHPAFWSKVWDERVEDRLYRNADIFEIKSARSYIGKDSSR